MKMNLDAVFEVGFQHGQDLVNANFFEVSLAESAELEDFEHGLRNLCWEANKTYNQLTPFDFFRPEIRHAENSVEAWERYELGVAEGIDFETNVLIIQAEAEFTVGILRCVNKLF